MKSTSHCFIGVAVAVLLNVVAAQAQAPQAAGNTNRVSIAIEGEQRVIRANGLPDHQPGQFPNANNPNSIAPQNYTFRVPLKPQAAATPRPVGMQPFGIATNGIVFDPNANEIQNITLKTYLLPHVRAVYPPPDAHCDQRR